MRHEDLTDPDEAERHLASCAECGEALDALSAFEAAEASRSVPAADAEAAWRGRRRPARVLVHAARAAVVLLAATGALALAGVELIPRRPSLTRADVDAALARFDAKLDERDRRRTRDVSDALESLDDARRADAAALVEEFALLRREVLAVRRMQQAFLDAPPSLPDSR